MPSLISLFVADLRLHGKRSAAHAPPPLPLGWPDPKSLIDYQEMRLDERDTPFRRFPHRDP
jgi:hypothetical protein